MTKHCAKAVGLLSTAKLKKKQNTSLTEQKTWIWEVWQNIWQTDSTDITHNMLLPQARPYLGNKLLPAILKIVTVRVIHFLSSIRWETVQICNICCNTFCTFTHLKTEEAHLSCCHPALRPSGPGTHSLIHTCAQSFSILCKHTYKHTDVQSPIITKSYKNLISKYT